MANREKDNLYFKFINWQEKYNEIIVLTMYAYANIDLPKKYEITFQIDNPNNFINTEFLIIQVVFNDWTAAKEIGSGHKHFAILQFKNPILQTFNLLPELEKSFSFNSKRKLGFCNKNNFETIKTKLLNK